MPIVHAHVDRERRRGFALLVVIIQIVLLAVLVYAFQRDVTRETSVALNANDRVEALYISRMGLVHAQALLCVDADAECDHLGEQWSQPITLIDETLADSQPVPHITITDEERKFNLFSLVRGNSEQREIAFEVFKRLIKICRREDPRLADHVSDGPPAVRRLGEDWYSAEVLTRNLVKYLNERAAEDSRELRATTGGSDVRAMRKQTPYDMLTLGELLQVEGFDDGVLLYGSDGDTRGETSPLIEFVTLYSCGRVNINTAPREVLLALDERLTREVVDQILFAREAERVAMNEPPPEERPAGTLSPGPFRDRALQSYQAFVERVTLREWPLPGSDEPLPVIPDFDQQLYAALLGWLTARSSVFEVTSAAKVNRIARTVRAVLRREPLPQLNITPGGTVTGATMSLTAIGPGPNYGWSISGVTHVGVSLSRNFGRSVDLVVEEGAAVPGSQVVVRLRCGLEWVEETFTIALPDGQVNDGGMRGATTKRFRPRPAPPGMRLTLLLLDSPTGD